MKIAPVSADLLIKLAMVAGVGLLGLYLVKQIGRAGAGLANTAASAVDAVGTGLNVTSDQNYAYRATNALGAGLVSADGLGRNADGSWSLGGWLYDVTH